MREFRIISKRSDAGAAGDNEVRTKPETLELVDRAASGDIEAFGELYRIYLDQVYRYVFYRVRNQMIAEDITEEAFIKAWKSIKSCKGKGQTFLPWLYRIAHNQLVDDFRSRRKETQLVDIDRIAEPADNDQRAEAGMEWQELTGLIAALPQNQGQVVTMKFIEGMDNREIGQAMGKSQGAIRILQMRALATLRQRLSGDR